MKNKNKAFGFCVILAKRKKRKSVFYIMSLPTQLIIQFNHNTPEQSLKCPINKEAALALYEYLLPEITKINPDYEGEMIGEFAAGVFTVDFVKAKDFHLVSKVIIQAANQLKSVQPFSAALQQSLMQDPRFQAV